MVSCFFVQSNSLSSYRFENQIATEDTGETPKANPAPWPGFKFRHPSHIRSGWPVFGLPDCRNAGCGMVSGSRKKLRRPDLPALKVQAWRFKITFWHNTL